MQSCCRQKEKRKVATHWIEQCQRKYIIHWIGQCQSRSAEYTGSETLSEGLRSHCLVERSPVSSAFLPPSYGCRHAPPTACPPANSTRAGVAATDRLGGRRLAVVAVDNGGGRGSRGGGVPRCGRRQKWGPRPGAEAAPVGGGGARRGGAAGGGGCCRTRTGEGEQVHRAPPGLVSAGGRDDRDQDARTGPEQHEC